MLVWAVFLLWNGNYAIRQGVRLFQLVIAYVLYNSLCGYLGFGIARMERKRCSHKMRFMGGDTDIGLFRIHNRVGAESLKILPMQNYKKRPVADAAGAFFVLKFL